MVSKKSKILILLSFFVIFLHCSIFSFLDNPRVNTRKLIVDEWDPMTLKCTFASNCNLRAIWYKKDPFNSLISDDDIFNAGNYTYRVMIYNRKRTIKAYAKYSYKCKIQDTPVVEVNLIVNGKFASKNLIKINRFSWLWCYVNAASDDINAVIEVRTFVDMVLTLILLLMPRGGSTVLQLLLVFF